MRTDMIGYACINQTLRNVKPVRNAIFCGRSITKKTFNIKTASERALANCLDLLTILKWNESHNIRCFRISSDLFPRFTCNEFGYSFNDLPDARAIRYTLKSVGDYAHTHGHQLSFHPGPFTTLASPNEAAKLNGIREVLYHNTLCDLIDPDNNLQIDINFHIGGSYGGTFDATADRFCSVYDELPDSAKSRICIENDDKASMWSPTLLHKLIHIRTGVPLCFDAHHWLFCHDPDRTMQADYSLSKSTWSRPMQVHYSESKSSEKLIPAHSDYYLNPIPSFITECDDIYVHLECKAKELGLFKYRQDFIKEAKVA